MARRAVATAGSSSSSDWGAGPGVDEDLPTPTLFRQQPLLQPPQHPAAAAAGYCPRRSFSESGLADMGREGGPPVVVEDEATACLGLDEVPGGETELKEVSKGGRGECRMRPGGTLD